jgi:hypothetical protein
MPGRAALNDVSGAETDIRSTRMSGHNPAGISGSDTSAIGGEGRKGASGHGSLDEPPFTRIDTEVVGKPMNGLATGGQTGPDAGYGRTFKR